MPTVPAAAKAILDAPDAEPAVTPALLEVCRELFTETVAQGHGNADMAAVVHAIATRSQS